MPLLMIVLLSPLMMLLITVDSPWTAFTWWGGSAWWETFRWQKLP
jgi:hypothetical protein